MITKLLKKIKEQRLFHCIVFSLDELYILADALDDYLISNVAEVTTEQRYKLRAKINTRLFFGTNGLFGKQEILTYTGTGEQVNKLNRYANSFHVSRQLIINKDKSYSLIMKNLNDRIKCQLCDFVLDMETGKDNDND